MPFRREPTLFTCAAGIKRITPTTGGNQMQRLRIGISDGEHWVSVMLASQLNALVDEQRLQENSVARLEECLFNHVNGRPCASDSRAQGRQLAGRALMQSMAAHPTRDEMS